MRWSYSGGVLSISFNKLKTRFSLTALVVLPLSLLFAPLSIDASSLPAQSRAHRLYHSSALNWSGYAAATNLATPTAGSATDVKGSWVVPSLNCATDGYASTWVGLDGYASSSVEQIGIESECHSGKASYYIWYEMYPSPMRLMSTNVKAGDSVTAEVKASGSIYRLSLRNNTTGRSYSTSKIMRSAAKSSAEWIQEAPSNYLGQTLPLANYGQVNITGAVATISGKTGPISSFANDPITMVNAVGKAISVPSALGSAGNSFSVSYK